MWLIRRGLEKNVDVSIYANLNYEENQMLQILYGLEKNLDVSCYAKPEYTWQKMERIRQQKQREKSKNE